MRLHSLELNNVRGVEHLRIEDLPETGVVVIHGENEAGKSTLIEAINTVLTERHKNRNDRLRPLQPKGRDVGPEVILEATVGPVRFRIRKRWLKKSLAELTVLAPRSNSFTGREADDELEKILGEHLDRPLVDALFLRQDDLGEGIAAVGIPSLTQALEEESGLEHSAVAADDSRLMQRVEEEWLRYFTRKTGQPTGEYKQAQARLAEAEEATSTAAANSRELEDVVVRHESLEHTREEAGAALPAARIEREELRAKAEQAKAAQTQLERLAENVDRAEHHLARARADVNVREELAAAARDSQHKAERAATEAATARTAAEAETQQRDSLQAELDTAKEQLAQSRGRVKQARQRLEALSSRERLEELSKKLDELDAIGERLRAARAVVSQRPQTITASDEKRVTAAETELTVARRVAKAEAARLEIRAEGAQALTVDGEEREVTGTTSVDLHDGTTLGIGKLELVYRGNEAPSAAALAKAEQALAEALESLGADDVEQVRNLAAAYRDEDAQLEQVKKEYAATLGGADLEQLRGERESLAGQDMPAEGLNREDATAAVRETEREEDSARDAVEACEAALVPLVERVAVSALARAESVAEAAQAQAQRDAQTLDTARAERSDEELSTVVAQAEEDLAAHREAHAAAQAELQASDAATAAKLYEGAEANVAELERVVQESQVELARLSSQIEQHAGVAEREQQANDELHAAQAIHDSVERRALAAQHLRELLLRHRDEARARYAEPFMAKLSGLARTVYGGDTSFVLSDDLQVDGRTRDGQTVDLAQLSGGAREQLAIITRFAIAELVAESTGQDVPIVVDDALGSTDTTRLQLMATLFADIGKRAQVIVLTCMPSRYGRVPGKLSYDIEALKS